MTDLSKKKKGAHPTEEGSLMQVRKLLKSHYISLNSLMLSLSNKAAFLIIFL
jgi:hypothetical protein